MKRKLLVPVLAIGLTVLAGVGLIVAWPQAPLDSALTSPAAPPARLVCYGYVDCRQGPLLLQPARSGRVVRVFVKERQTVGKDMPLVQLDDRLVKLQEEQAELAIQAAQLQLTKARAGLKQYQARQAQVEAALEAAHKKELAAQHYLAVKEDLFKNGFGNKDEVAVVRAQLDEAKALVKAEQNKLAELRAVDPELEVKLAQLQRDRCQVQREQARQERAEYVLKAPADGMVLRVQAQEGDLVSPTSPKPAVWLAPQGAKVIRAEVSQEFAGRVHPGLAVRVEDEASASLLARGMIAEVSDWLLPRRQLSAQPTGINTGLTLECVIDLEEGHAPLRLGQRVRVRVLADQPAGPSSS
jgi:multidrug resistance efflux pump